jgi:hypothetical protein
MWSQNCLWSLLTVVGLGGAVGGDFLEARSVGLFVEMRNRFVMTRDADEMTEIAFQNYSRVALEGPLKRRPPVRSSVGEAASGGGLSGDRTRPSPVKRVLTFAASA